MTIIGDLKNPKSLLSRNLILNFMNNSWIKYLLLRILKVNNDFIVVIPWEWDKKTIKLNLLENIIVIGKNQSMIIFWEEFLGLNGDQKTPFKYLIKIIKKL
ncbi:MAG: hypothetical protein PHZ07_03595 [Patescibacteria group bacterium]|nr:hypothetical protein [Patescibacteria group bacterium]MDD4304447.1 hypothetical protein [Patescibacteria group bacterium]MDD4695470.1 hypothetical protein [Patescibacteria group bacterium]